VADGRARQLDGDHLREQLVGAFGAEDLAHPAFTNLSRESIGADVRPEVCAVGIVGLGGSAGACQAVVRRKQQRDLGLQIRPIAESGVNGRLPGARVERLDRREQ
jgi:hypothetical protein